MPRYLIERTIPGAGKLSRDELRAISQRSCAVLADMGGRAQWVQSFVSDDKVYCVYLARDESALREHAEAGGFPIDRIYPVRTVIDPTTAD